MAEKHPPETTPAGGQQPAQPQSEIVLDDRNTNVAYANFALNPNTFLTGKQEIAVAQKLILNFFAPSACSWPSTARCSVTNRRTARSS